MELTLLPATDTAITYVPASAMGTISAGAGSRPCPPCSVEIRVETVPPVFDMRPAETVFECA